MKKHLVCFFVAFLFSNFIFSQDWKEVFIDTNVSVVTITPLDTIENSADYINVGVKTREGSMSFWCWIAEDQPAKSYNEFKQNESDMIQGSLAAGHGKMIDSSTFYIRDIEGMRIRSEMTEPNGKKVIVDNKIVFINGRVYCLSFIQPKTAFVDSCSTRDRFLNSLKINININRENQYNLNPKVVTNISQENSQFGPIDYYKIGYWFGKIIVFVGIIILIILLIRRFKK